MQKHLTYYNPGYSSITCSNQKKKRKNSIAFSTNSKFTTVPKLRQSGKTLVYMENALRWLSRCNCSVHRMPPPLERTRFLALRRRQSIFTRTSHDLYSNASPPPTHLIIVRNISMPLIIYDTACGCCCICTSILYASSIAITPPNNKTRGTTITQSTRNRRRQIQLHIFYARILTV